MRIRASVLGNPMVRPGYWGKAPRGSRVSGRFLRIQDGRTTFSVMVRQWRVAPPLRRRMGPGLVVEP